MAAQRKYPEELRERAVKMVSEIRGLRRRNAAADWPTEPRSPPGQRATQARQMHGSWPATLIAWHRRPAECQYATPCVSWSFLTERCRLVLL